MSFAFNEHSLFQNNHKKNISFGKEKEKCDGHELDIKEQFNNYHKT